jgi:hypothetical protein
LDFKQLGDSKVIVFEGDFVRRGNSWFEVVDIGAMDMVQLSDGNWALACETELDEVMSAIEYNAMISGDIA